jgi:hypothetical protein
MSIVSLSQAPLAQLDALILNGRFQEAADNFCQPACGCHEIHDWALRTMETGPLSPCARPRKKTVAQRRIPQRQLRPCLAGVP